LAGGAELAALADRAALLAKADLLTDMVGEFPELQGIMGRYYALHDGEDPLVAEAIEDHYKPRFAGDELPRNDAGLCVALADKLETLVGLFGIGEKPTGDKDPFALRRHALGVIRILMDKPGLFAGLPLITAIDTAAQQFDGVTGFVNPLSDVQDFIYERLSGLLREGGFTALEIDSVLALRPQHLHDTLTRLDAVRAFTALPEAAALAAANKRVANILKKSVDIGILEADRRLMSESAEVALADALADIAPKAETAYESGDYKHALLILAGLKEPVDSFFDHVMVNVDDEAVRNNRLALLIQLRAAMNRVAVLSRLAA
jgi:glycyl-tRNA synthetase beta chain